MKKPIQISKYGSQIHSLLCECRTADSLHPPFKSDYFNMLKISSSAALEFGVGWQCESLIWPKRIMRPGCKCESERYEIASWESVGIEFSPRESPDLVIESSMDYDAGNDGKGILFSMSRSWVGTDANSSRFIWKSELVDESSNSIGSRDNSILNTEIGYGFEFLDGSTFMTPYTAFNQTKLDGIEFQVGNRFATTTGIDFELEAIRDIPESGYAEHEINLTENISW